MFVATNGEAIEGDVLGSQSALAEKFPFWLCLCASLSQSSLSLCWLHCLSFSSTQCSLGEIKTPDWFFKEKLVTPPPPNHPIPSTLIQAAGDNRMPLTKWRLKLLSLLQQTQFDRSLSVRGGVGGCPKVYVTDVPEQRHSKCCLTSGSLSGRWR